MSTPSDEADDPSTDEADDPSTDTEEPILVELRFYAPFKDEVGQKSLTVELPGDATMDDALARAVEEYPALDGALLDDGQIPDGVRALHNGRASARTDTRLEDGDEVSFTTPIHGG